MCSTKDQVALGACSMVARGRKVVEEVVETARLGFSWLPMLFRPLHLLKAAPSALTNAGDRMAEQQPKAFTPFLTSNIHLGSGASCAAWAVSLTHYYTNTDLGRFCGEGREGCESDLCLSSCSLSVQRPSECELSSGPAYRQSPQLSFNGIDPALNTLSYQSKLFRAAPDISNAKTSWNLEQSKEMFVSCKKSEDLFYYLGMPPWLWSPCIIELIFLFVFKESQCDHLMEELLSGFLTNAILAGCWCTWAQTEDASVPLLLLSIALNLLYCSTIKMLHVMLCDVNMCMLLCNRTWQRSGHIS